MEQIGSDNDTQDIVRRRRCRTCSHRTPVNVHNHCTLRVCQKFLQSWFLCGIFLVVAGLTSMVIAAQNLKLNICDWATWVAYITSTLTLIGGVALISSSVAKCIRFIIDECQADFVLESFPPESSSEEDPSTLPDPQPVPADPEPPRNPSGPIKVHATVHRTQGSFDSLRNDSLCNFVRSEESSANNSSETITDVGKEDTENSTVQESSDGNVWIGEQRANYSKQPEDVFVERI